MCVKTKRYKKNLRKNAILVFILYIIARTTPPFEHDQRPHRTTRPRTLRILLVFKRWSYQFTIKQFFFSKHRIRTYPEKHKRVEKKEHREVNSTRRTTFTFGSDDVENWSSSRRAAARAFNVNECATSDDAMRRRTTRSRTALSLFPRRMSFLVNFIIRANDREGDEESVGSFTLTPYTNTLCP